MLFAYPTAAAAQNWLHTTLLDAIRQGMDDLDAGRKPLIWPTCLDAARRQTLGRHHGLRDRLTTLLTCYGDLEAPAREILRRAIEEQAQLQPLFEGVGHAERLSDLPASSREPAKRLFEHAFSMLTSLGIRDHNYRVFLRDVQHRVCAFCGCEYFSGAKSKREALDHYLAISLYPFAGANAHNLVPMGPRCNSSYKLAQDILRDQYGLRRLCFDPYCASQVHISLLETQLFARDDGLPAWQVRFEGDARRIQTWNEVFAIEQRLIEDHLDSIYKNVVKVVGALRRRNESLLTERANICEAFEYLAELSRAKGWSDRAFLEVALYELLLTRCEAGGPEAEMIRAEFDV